MRRNRRLPLAAGILGLCLTPLAVRAQDVQGKPVVADTTIDVACAPQAAVVAPVQSLRILGGQQRGQRLFGTNDAVVLSSGTDKGVGIGQEYFVRRVVPDRFTTRLSDGTQPLSIHTAGWIRVVETKTDSAIAIITASCDGVLDGDYLEPFQVPSAPAAAVIGGEPDYTDPGHLILGDDRRQMGGLGSMMVIDRGSDHGVRAGQRMTVFRNATGGSVHRIGDAIVITAGPESSLVRITRSNDAVYVGDLVAIHR